MTSSGLFARNWGRTFAPVAVKSTLATALATVDALGAVASATFGILGSDTRTPMSRGQLQLDACPSWGLRVWRRDGSRVVRSLAPGQ
jgi:hypothetical protein